MIEVVGFAERLLGEAHGLFVRLGADDAFPDAGRVDDAFE
jgi:hypothetical protein